MLIAAMDRDVRLMPAPDAATAAELRRQLARPATPLLRDAYGLPT
jgi:hypothetical protein